MTRCGTEKYKGLSCCTRASAKRAYNYVYEDDGCGVVGYVCATALTNIACAVNCATDLVVSGYNYNNSRPVLPGKVVISATAAKTLYAACQGYAWCGTQQQMTTECSFLAVTIQARSKGSSSAQLSIRSSPDTCTLVADLNPVSFAENILGLVVHEDDTPGFVSTIDTVPYVQTADAARQAGTVGTSLLLAAAAALVTLAQKF